MLVLLIDRELYERTSQSCEQIFYRQHPCDLFDVRMLLEEDGISGNIFVGFLTNIQGHPRPINEVMALNWQSLNEKFRTEFEGMTAEEVDLDDLTPVG